MNHPSLKDCWLRGGLFFRFATLIITAFAAFILPRIALAQVPTSIISVTSDLNFSNVPAYNIKGMTLAITNSGNSALTISNVTVPNGFFPVGFGIFPMTVDPGVETNLSVIFSPTNVAEYGGTGTVISDATGGNDEFTISGEGTYPSGRFIGLFFSATNAAFEDSGYFSVKITDRGAVSGKLLLGSRDYPFSGRLSSSCDFSGTTATWGADVVHVSFHAAPFGYVGVVSNSAGVAELSANRALVSAGLPGVNELPPGKYKFQIAGSTNQAVAPTNSGRGTIDLTPSRAAHVSGILGDGTPFSQSTLLSLETELPLYASLYRRQGAVLGWIRLEVVLTNFPPQFPTNITVLPRTDIILPPTNIIILPPTNILLPPTNAVPFTNFVPNTNIPPIQILPSSFVRTNPVAGISALGTNLIIGELDWFKPARIDRNYPDGFSFQTRVSGPVE